MVHACLLVVNTSSGSEHPWPLQEVELCHRLSATTGVTVCDDMSVAECDKVDCLKVREIDRRYALNDAFY